MWRAWVAVLLLTPLQAAANTLHCGGYDIQYTTFVSTVIPPRVAAAHHIVRGNDRLITNVSVERDGKSVAARVAGTATNLLNQVTRLDFRAVRERGTVYYLASQLVNARDTIRYALTVRPGQSKAPCRFEFIRDYYRAGSR